MNRALQQKLDIAKLKVKPVSDKVTVRKPGEQLRMNIADMR